MATGSHSERMTVGVTQICEPHDDYGSACSSSPLQQLGHEIGRHFRIGLAANHWTGWNGVDLGMMTSMCLERAASQD